MRSACGLVRRCPVPLLLRTGTSLARSSDSSSSSLNDPPSSSCICMAWRIRSARFNNRRILVSNSSSWPSSCKMRRPTERSNEVSSSWDCINASNTTVDFSMSVVERRGLGGVLLGFDSIFLGAFRFLPIPRALPPRRDGALADSEHMQQTGHTHILLKISDMAPRRSEKKYQYLSHFANALDCTKTGAEGPGGAAGIDRGLGHTTSRISTRP
jgi:hypothetical protein